MSYRFFLGFCQSTCQQHDEFLVKFKECIDALDVDSRCQSLDWLILSTDDIKQFFENHAHTLFTVPAVEALSELDKLQQAFKNDTVTESHKKIQSKEVMKRIGNKDYWFDHDTGSMDTYISAAEDTLLKNFAIGTYKLPEMKRNALLLRSIVGILFQYYVMGNYRIDIASFRNKRTNSAPKRQKREDTPSNEFGVIQTTNYHIKSMNSYRNGMLYLLLQMKPNKVLVNESVTVQAIISNIPKRFMKERLPKQFKFDNLGVVEVSQYSYYQIQGNNSFYVDINAPQCSYPREISITTNGGDNLRCRFEYISDDVQQLELAAQNLHLLPLLNSLVQNNCYYQATNIQYFQSYENIHPTHKNPLHVAAMLSDYIYIQSLSDDLIASYATKLDTKGESALIIACQQSSLNTFLLLLYPLVKENENTIQSILEQTVFKGKTAMQYLLENKQIWTDEVVLYEDYEEIIYPVVEQKNELPKEEMITMNNDFLKNKIQERMNIEFDTRMQMLKEELHKTSETLKEGMRMEKELQMKQSVMSKQIDKMTDQMIEFHFETNRMQEFQKDQYHEMEQKYDEQISQYRKLENRMKDFQKTMEVQYNEMKHRMTDEFQNHMSQLHKEHVIQIEQLQLETKRCNEVLDRLQKFRHEQEESAEEKLREVNK